MKSCRLAPVDEFQHEEVELVVVIDVVSADDIRMIEASDRAGFAIEAGERGRVFGLLDRQNLEGDLAAHGDVFAQEDLPHAAGAEAVEQAIFLADDEPAPAAGDQFLGLEVSEDAFLDEGIRQFLGRLRPDPCAAPVRLARLERLPFEQTALEAEFEEPIDRSRCRHGPLPWAFQSQH